MLRFTLKKRLRYYDVVSETKHMNTQWRTRKIFMGGVHLAAHGGYLHLVCTVCDVTI